MFVGMPQSVDASAKANGKGQQGNMKARDPIIQQNFIRIKVTHTVYAVESLNKDAPVIKELVKIHVCVCVCLFAFLGGGAQLHRGYIHVNLLLNIPIMVDWRECENSHFGDEISFPATVFLVPMLSLELVVSELLWLRGGLSIIPEFCTADSFAWFSASLELQIKIF